MVAGELGGGCVGGCLVRVSSGVGGCVSGAAARGCCGACLVGIASDVGAAAGSGCGDRTDGGGVDGRLVGVSAVADVSAVVVLAAIPVSASTLVAVRAPVVVALVAAVLGVAAIPVGVVAAAAVLSWVCESGVVSQGWVGELVEGWWGCGVDGRCGVLVGVLSSGLMRISVKKMVLRSFLRLGGVFGWV